MDEMIERLVDASLFVINKYINKMISSREKRKNISTIEKHLIQN